MKKPVVLIFAALLLAGCAAAVSSPDQATPQPPSVSTDAPVAVQPAESDSLSRTDSQGAVTFKVTPLNLDNPADILQFDVSIHTPHLTVDADYLTLSKFWHR